VDLDRGARDERAAIARAAGYRFKDNYFPHFFSAYDEVKFSKDLLGRAADYYATNPGVFLKCSSLNLANFWFAGKNRLATTLNVLVQLPYLLLAAMGAGLLIRKEGWNTQVTPIALIIVYSMLAYAVTFAQARYSVPLIPLLSLLGAYSLAQIWNRMSIKGERP
jgi:hypothetical protein